MERPAWLASASSLLFFAGAALAQHGAAPAAAAAPGAEQGSAGVIPTAAQGIMPMLVAIGVFLVVFAILAVKVWPLINKGLTERADKIRSEIEAAEAARAQAKAALEQYERALADARVEAQKEIDKARAAAQALGSELKAKNEAEIQVMKGKAIAEIDAAKRQALSEIYSEAASLSTLVAAKILQREITKGDQQRLVDDALSELKTASAR